MLKKVFLAGNTIYACIYHNDKILKKYLNCLDQVLKIISKYEKNGQIDMFLKIVYVKLGLKD